MGDELVTLADFGVSFGEQVILSNVTLDIPRRGITVLVGPAGAGKSTLLRTLAGLNDAHSSFSTWGHAAFNGTPLGSCAPLSTPGEVRRGVGMVVQHARFYVDSVRQNLASALPNRSELELSVQREIVSGLLRANGLAELVAYLDEDVVTLSKPLQRRLAIVRALASEPLLLLADEPTAGLEDDDARAVLDLLRAQARSRAVLLVTHNQRFARATEGTIVLLAQGRVQEIGPSERFFTAPSTPQGETFQRTGGCLAKDAEAEAEAEPKPVQSTPRPEAPAVRSRYDGPRGFFWLLPGQLGGLPRPGIVAATEQDLAGLQRLGVSTLVTLEESRTVDAQLLSDFGIHSIHFPVPDMSAPRFDSAAELCRRIEELIASSGVVALHCRAGLGRTGTLLACQLIWRGELARNAIDRVRRLNPMCIQSQAQLQFLSGFAAELADSKAS